MYLLRKRWGIEGGLGWRRGEYVVEKDAAVALAVAVTVTILDCCTHVNSCLVNLAVDLCSVCMGIRIKRNTPDTCSMLKHVPEDPPGD